MKTQGTVFISYTLKCLQNLQHCFCNHYLFHTAIDQYLITKLHSLLWQFSSSKRILAVMAWFVLISSFIILIPSLTSTARYQITMLNSYYK